MPGVWPYKGKKKKKKKRARAASPKGVYPLRALGLLPREIAKRPDGKFKQGFTGLRAVAHKKQAHENKKLVCLLPMQGGWTDSLNG